MNFDNCVGEVRLTYKRTAPVQQELVKSSSELHKVAMSIYDADTLDYRETAYLILMNTQGRINGYFKIAECGIDLCPIDTRLALQAILLTNSTLAALVHNHPSGNVKPSTADDRITEHLSRACKAIDASLIDSIIIASNGEYYSYADNLKI